MINVTSFEETPKAGFILTRVIIIALINSDGEFVPYDTSYLSFFPQMKID